MDEHEKPIAAAFAARLKTLRSAAGWTMAELGERVEPPILAPAVARYESGDRVPRWSAVVRLARALGVSVAEFDVEPGSAVEKAAQPQEAGTKGKGTRKK